MRIRWTRSAAQYRDAAAALAPRLPAHHRPPHRPLRCAWWRRPSGANEPAAAAEKGLLVPQDLALELGARRPAGLRRRLRSESPPPSGSTAPAGRRSGRKSPGADVRRVPVQAWGEPAHFHRPLAHVVGVAGRFGHVDGLRGVDRCRLEPRALPHRRRRGNAPQRRPAEHLTRKTCAAQPYSTGGNTRSVRRWLLRRSSAPNVTARHGTAAQHGRGFA